MKPLVLIVCDGLGHRKSTKCNAIKQAKPSFLKNKYILLNASGKHVGLLPGYMGNSEVGHLHLGAGRLCMQDLARISKEIKNKTFFKNKYLLHAMKHAKKKDTLHLMGLLSDAGVHSHIDHLFALLDMAKQFKIKQVYVHLFLDGRDMPPQSAGKLIKKVEKKLKKPWQIATIIGRFYAMDRDNRWEREHKAYDAMVNCKGYFYTTAKEALKATYARGETDEFVKPSVIGSKTCNVKPGDTVIFFNFRSDRAREITRAFIQGKFKKFKRRKLIGLHFVSLTQYDPDISVEVAYHPITVKNTLGEWLAKHKATQLRLAETEKWAHVTFFFNGISGIIFPKEARKLIPSPKVRTYDQTPAMKAPAIANYAVNAIRKHQYDFILINFANADMVGHTGNLKATVKGVKVMDKAVTAVVDAARHHKYTVVITADHGNAEEMCDTAGKRTTAHTTNKVPLVVLADHPVQFKRIKNPSLYHIAPTILDLMNLPKPKEMAQSLLKH